MSKQKNDNSKYIDPEHKITRTPLHLYNYALDQLGKAEEVTATFGLQKAMVGYSAIIQTLGEALLFGEEGAAPALAYLFYHGYGTKKDINKVKLYIAIGNSLQNKICMNYMKGENNEIFDIAGFLQSKPVYSKSILDMADKYADACKINAKNYPNNQIITSEIAVEAINIFEAADPTHALDPFGKGYHEQPPLLGEYTKHSCDIL